MQEKIIIIATHYFIISQIRDDELHFRTALLVVTKARPFNRSVRILKQLHWLPVKFNIHQNISPQLSEP